MIRNTHRVKVRTALAVLAAALALTLTAGLGRPADASFPGANGEIAFERFGDIYLASPGGSDARKIEIAGSQANPAISPDGGKVAYEHAYGIWVMDADGTERRRVSDGTSSTAFTDTDPAWSPDGEKLVFKRYRSGDSDLWTVDLDGGTGQKNLTGTPGYDEEDPAWSPTGGEIAYTRVGCEPPRGGISCVFKMNTNGSGQTNLTSEDNFHQGVSSEPSWSPDGARIAFRGAVDTDHSSGTDIWTMAADGSDKRNVTDDNGTGDNHPAFSPDGEKIAFNSSRPGGSPTAIYLIDTDGGAVTRLAASTGYDNDPDWGPLPPTPIPEGGVVFASDRGGDFEIHGMNPDGAHRFPLTSNAASDTEPAFSPDGEKVAFVSDRGGDEDLYLMNPDGTGQARLTDNAAADRQPAFSPDGDRITFVSERDGNEEIYVMDASPEDAATNAPRRLTHGGASDAQPAWSPDGRRIAFVSRRSGDGLDAGADLWSMNPDGSGQARLLDAPVYDEGGPDYAPDGGKIAFGSTLGSPLCDNGVEFCQTTDLFVIGASSGTPARLTSDVATYDERPAYSPDGARIAFRTNRDGNQEIYAMFADGTGATRLTDDPARDTDPDWRPVVSPPPDTTAPNTTISSAPPALTRSAAASFAFASSEPGSRFECSLDGSAFAPCSSPKGYTTLSSTAHIFKVRALDAAGNADPTPATRAWTVDAVEPSIGSLSPPGGSTTRDRTPAIKAIVRDSQANLQKGNIRLYVDGRQKTAFAYTSSTDRLSYTSSALKPGRHTVKIVAKDAAGNTSSRAWGFVVKR